MHHIDLKRSQDIPPHVARSDQPQGQMGHRTVSWGWGQAIQEEIQMAKLSLKSIFCDLGEFFCSLAGYDQQSKLWNQRSKHYEELLKNLEDRTKKRMTWDKALLVPSINVSKQSSVDDSAKYTKAFKELTNGHLSFIGQEPIDPKVVGVCAGATLDFGKRLLELSKKEPIGTEGFKKGLIRLAHKYQNGIGKRGTAKQIAFERINHKFPKFSLTEKVMGFAKNTGMHLTQMTTAVRDSDSLQKLPKDNGVYPCIFTTKSDSKLHTGLFIVSGNETFIWDPNTGLIDCLNQPKETFEKLFSQNLYTNPDFPNQHRLWIGKLA